MTEPSPTLDEFLPRYKRDDNEWWRLGSGDHQNLFDEAVEEVERLRAEAEEWKLRYIEAKNPGIDMDEVRRSRG